MKCSEVEIYLQAYVDGEFGGAEEGEIEQHFKFCPVCQKKVAMAVWLKEGLRAAVPDQAAPAGLRMRLTSVLAEERNQAVPVWIKLAPVMVMALVFVGAFFFPRIEISSPIVDATVGGHVRGLPLDVRSDNVSEVKDYFMEKLNWAIPIPRFDRRKISLAGGRVAAVHNCGCATISYQGNGRRYTMMVAPEREVPMPHLKNATVRRAGQRDVVLTRQNGLTVAIWQEGNATISLASDEEEGDLLNTISDAEFAR